MAGAIMHSTYYCGVVAYSSGTVVWTADWTPEVSDPAPDIFTDVPANGSVCRVAPAVLSGPLRPGLGVLVLSATVDGVAAEQSAQIRWYQSGADYIAEWGVFSAAGGVELREDGGRELREDGGRELRE